MKIQAFIKNDDSSCMTHFGVKKDWDVQKIIKFLEVINLIAICSQDSLPILNLSKNFKNQT